MSEALEVTAAAALSLETTPPSLAATAATLRGLTEEEAAAAEGQPTSLAFLRTCGASDEAVEVLLRPSSVASLKCCLRSAKSIRSDSQTTPPYIDADLEQVPTAWLNQRLVELGERWRVDEDEDGPNRTLRQLDNYCSLAFTVTAEVEPGRSLLAVETTADTPVRTKGQAGA